MRCHSSPLGLRLGLAAGLLAVVSLPLAAQTIGDPAWGFPHASPSLALVKPGKLRENA